MVIYLMRGGELEEQQESLDSLLARMKRKDDTNERVVFREWSMGLMEGANP